MEITKKQEINMWVASRHINNVESGRHKNSLTGVLKSINNTSHNFQVNLKWTSKEIAHKENIPETIIPLK